MKDLIFFDEAVMNFNCVKLIYMKSIGAFVFSPVFSNLIAWFFFDAFLKQ